MRTSLVLVSLLAFQVSYGQVPLFRVTMTPAAYESLYTRDIFSSVYLSAPLTYNDTTWNESEIRFKGNTTRYYPKKSFRMRFATSNLFQGMRQFNLNSMYTDKSYLREYLSWQIFREAGTLAPRGHHARFVLNNERKGVFLFIDKVDRYFLQRYNRVVAPMYDTEDVYAMSDLTIQPDSLLRLYYPKEIGPSGDYSDLRTMIEAINYAPDPFFADVVDTLFDMRSVYDWLAANILTMMGDTYNKNYLLYRDTSRANRQWTIIPWDYDISFGRTGDPEIPYPGSLLNDGFAYTFSPLSGPSNVLKDRLWNTPALRERLRLHVDTLLATIFTEQRMHGLIDSVAALVRNEVASDPQRWGTIEDFEDHVAALRYYVTARRNYLLRTFINPPSGLYNIVTLPITQLNVPYHFVGFDGRQIATMWFTQFSGLDSIRVRVYPDSTPPALIDPGSERFVHRWMTITPFPPQATFTARVEWMYEDILLSLTERGSGVQDERLLGGYSYDGVSWNPVPTRVNPYSNTAMMEGVTQGMSGPEKHFALLLPPTYTQTWFRQPHFFWQRWHDIRFHDAMNGLAVGEHGTALRTSDGGTSWSSHAIGLNLSFHALALRGVDTAFAVGEFGSLYSSTSGGTSWSQIPTGTTRNLRTIQLIGSSGWIAGDGIVLRSTDRGLTWSPVLLDSTTRIHQAIGFEDGSVLAAGRQGVAFFSPDGGATWQPRSTGTPRDILRLAGVGISGVWAIGDSGLALYSPDRGTTWSDVSVATTVSLRGVHAFAPDTAYVAGNSGRIYYTTNRGITWYPQHTADWHDLNAVAFVDTARGFAVGNGGTILASTSGGTTTGIGPLPAIAGDFRLHQNYPNPFNPSTTVAFDIPVSSFVTLTIYNILGQEVATLIDRHVGPGRHEVTWDARNVATGVYFYRLMRRSSDGIVHSQQVKKMLLLR